MTQAPRRLAAILLTAGCSLVMRPASAADKILANTTFASDLDGWTSNTPAQVVWQATGGNPGGVALFTDQSADGTYIDAPSKFLSPAVPYTSLSGKGYISWQHKMGPQANVESISPYEIRLSGPGGAAKFDGSVPAVKPEKYYTVVAPLAQADWTVTSGTWAALLANVTDMQIDIELVTNNGNFNDTEYMDNIEVVSHPAGFSPGGNQ